MSSDSEDSSSEDEQILSFFASEEEKSAQDVSKHETNAEQQEPKQKKQRIEDSREAPQPLKNTKKIEAHIDARAFFEDESDYNVNSMANPLAIDFARELFECYICMRRVQMNDMELNQELIRFVYPNEKKAIEVCKTCIRRDRIKAEKLDKVNNVVEYNLQAKCLMPNPCKICGSYEHGSYECMIPESTLDQERDPEFDPTAPYR